MASLRVKLVHNLGEIQNSGLGYCPCRRRKGSVSYTNNHRHLPRLILSAAGVLSRNFRNDSDPGTTCSSGFSSVLDPNCSQLESLATLVTRDNRRRKDDVKEEDFSGKLYMRVKESVVEILKNGELGVEALLQP